MLSLSVVRPMAFVAVPETLLSNRWKKSVQFAAKYGAKVYVAANMVMHEGNEAGAGEWFRKLRDIGIAAVICLTQP